MTYTMNKNIYCLGVGIPFVFKIFGHHFKFMGVEIVQLICKIKISLSSKLLGGVICTKDVPYKQMTSSKVGTFCKNLQKLKS